MSAVERVVTNYTSEVNSEGWNVADTPTVINTSVVYDITYGNDIFVAVTHSSANFNVGTSIDGVDWIARQTPYGGNSWRSVAFGNGVFVAVSQDGEQRSMVSDDGINWTATNIQLSM